MTRRQGLGDRWLAGDPIEGIRFAHHATVEISGGSLDGRRGTIVLLLAATPEPVYLVAVAEGGDVRIRQSALRAT